MDDPRLSAEGELALARLAISDDDFTHAAAHVAGAIAYAPTMPEVHEVLAQLAARTGGGLELFPLDQQAFIGTVVARAHLLAAAGNPAEGLELLAAATGYAPSTGWADVPWISAPGLAARVDADRLTRILMRICASIPDPVPVPDRQPLRPYLRLARQAVDAHPEHGLLLGAASALARRLGETDLAVDWARRGTRTSAGKLAEVWLGYAYRSAGRTAEALAALRRAVAHDPDDLSVYADIAGTLADNGRLDEALRWIDRALARNPSFDCAVHTGHRLRFQRDGALEHLVALADYQRDHPDDSHEHTDLADCCHGSPWLGQLPPASEAVANALRQLLADRPGSDDTGSHAGDTGSRADDTGSRAGDTGSRADDTGSRAGDTGSRADDTGSRAGDGSVPAGDHSRAGDGRRTVNGASSGGRGRIPFQGRLRLSGLEPPSAMRALAAAAPGLDVTVAEAPEPDIRRPRRAAEHQLWRYDGMVAAPAGRPPSATAVERIRQLAHPAWAHPPAAYDGAVGLATLDLDDLLGLLTHPPEPPPTTLGRALAEHDPTLWVRCVQVWACLGLLHHHTDEPWATSTRRQVLLDLVWGVEDWTTEAALFALVTYAWVEPAVRAEVARIAAERLADGVRVARDRPVSIIWSLAQLVLATPAMEPAMIAAARLVFTASEPDHGGPGPLARLWRRLTRGFRRNR